MGPFSSPAVIGLLNQYFVPVKATTEDYVKKKSKPFFERELLREIWQRADEKQFSRGTVHTYIVTATGDVYGTQHVRDAARIATLVRFLRKAIVDLDSRAGSKLVVAPRRRKIPHASNDNIVLQVASEYTDSPGTVGQDWVLLEKSEWSSFSPGDRNQGEAWGIEPGVARKLLVHLYPFSQDWDVSHNKFSKCELSATVVSRGPQRVVAIRGELLMDHNRHTDRTPEPVKAEIIGVVEFRPEAKPTFRLTTGEATYGGRRFDGLIINVQE